MDAGRAIRDARVRRGMTQAELAARARTSQPNLSAYEQGRRTPSLEVFERLLAAMGLSLAVARSAAIEERKARALHAAVVARLAADPAAGLAKARRNMERLRAVDTEGHAREVLDAWSELLDGPIERVVEVLLGTDADSDRLASANPFAGLLTPTERWTVLRRVRAEAGEREASGDR